MLNHEYQCLSGRSLNVCHIFKFRQSWTSESEMVVPVDLPSVKPRSQCLVRRVNSSLKLWQRKQLDFPALASLTDRVHCTHTHSRKPYPPTYRRWYHNTSALREPMTSMQMRQIIRWTASFAPPYNIQIFHLRQGLHWNDDTLWCNFHGNRISQEETQQYCWL